MKEIWKDIEGYEGLYQISNYGKIKSFHKNKILILNNSIDRYGYYFIRLSKNGESKRFAVHRLVCFAFIPNKENKPYVNHKDGNPKNNNVNNLEWCTPSENMFHKTRVLGYNHSEQTKKKLSMSAKKRGIHPNTIKSHYKKCRCVETGIIYNSQMEAEQKTGIPHKQISAGIKRKYKVYGYYWENVDEKRI